MSNQYSHENISAYPLSTLITDKRPNMRCNEQNIHERKHFFTYTPSDLYSINSWLTIKQFILT